MLWPAEVLSLDVAEIHPKGLTKPVLTVAYFLDTLMGLSCPESPPRGPDETPPGSFGPAYALIALT